MKKMIAMMIGFVLILSLAGCTSPEETPGSVVEKGLQAVKVLDASKIETYFDVSNDSIFEQAFDDSIVSEDVEILELMTKKLSFKILEETIDGDKAVVKVELTNIDMGKVAMEYFVKAMEIAFGNMFNSDIDEDEMQEKMLQAFKDILSDDERDLVTVTVDVELKKMDSSWKINLSDDLVNGLFGGLSDIGLLD